MRRQPIMFEWKELDVCVEGGEVVRMRAMVPHKRYQRVAQRQYTLDGEYVLDELDERSEASHRQYFAAINDGFRNLPESVAANFSSAEHLRAWCLIECGYHEERIIDCESEREAKRYATFIRIEKLHARLKRREDKLVVQYPRSQAYGAMNKHEFEKSKRDVLELIESMIELHRGALMKEAGRSA